MAKKGFQKDEQIKPLKAAQTSKYDDIWHEGMKRFQQCMTDEYEDRILALDDFKFAHGEQWPEQLKQARESQGRPCLTINRLRRFIKSVVGDQRQNRPQVKFIPVDDRADVKIAEILEGLHRHVWYSSSGDEAIDTAFEHAFTCGRGFFRVLHDYCGDDSFYQDIIIQKIANPFTVYLDQGHKKPDYTDLRYAFISDLMPKEVYEAKYGDIPAISISCDGYGDFDGNGQWLGETTVRVAEYYYVVEEDDTLYLLPNGLTVFKSEYDEAIHGQWIDSRKTKNRRVMWCLLSGAGVIEKPRETPSRYIPIVPVYGDPVNIDGKRIYKGGIRDCKDPQRTYNYWSSTAAEMLQLQPKAPLIVDKEGIEGFETQWNTLNVKPWPYLPIDGSRMKFQPFRIDPAPMSQGFVDIIGRSEDDMKATSGIYDAALGNRSNETSGKAILARQRESDITTFSFVDNLTRGLIYYGKIFLDMVPKIYDSERILRIEAEDGSVGTEQVNQVALINGMIRILNDMTVGKYDVRVTVGPSYLTQRMESVESLLQFAQAFPMAAPAIVDLAAENLDFKNADQMARRLKAMLPPQITEADKNFEMQENGELPEGSAQQQAQGQPPQAEQQQGQSGPGGQQPNQPPFSPMEFMKMQAMQEKAKADQQRAALDLQRAQVQMEQERLELQQKQLEYRAKQIELGIHVDQQRAEQQQMYGMQNTEQDIRRMVSQVVMEILQANRANLGQSAPGNNQSLVNTIDPRTPGLPRV